MSSGQSGLVAEPRRCGIDYKPVTRVENFCATGSEAFRNACYAVASGAYDRVMAVGVEKLKDSGYSGLVRSQRRRRRHRAGADAHRAGRVLAARPRLLQEVRRRPAGHARGDDPRRLEEPRQRRARTRARSSARRCPKEKIAALADRRRPARRVRLLGRLRRRGLRADRPRRGRATSTPTGRCT